MKNKWYVIDLWKNDKQQVTCRVMRNDFLVLSVELNYTNGKFVSFYRRPKTYGECVQSVFNSLNAMSTKELNTRLGAIKLENHEQYATLERYIFGEE